METKWTYNRDSERFNLNNGKSQLSLKKEQLLEMIEHLKTIEKRY